MKNNYLIILLLPLLLASCGTGNNVVKRFYAQNKHKEGVQNFSVPGWLIWLGSGIAISAVDDEDAKPALRLAKKVKRLRIMVAENSDPVSQSEINQFVKDMRLSEYSDLIQIRDEKTNVNIFAKEKEDVLKELVILVKDEKEFVFLGMKTSISIDDLSKVISTYIEKELGGKEFEEEVPKDKKPVVRPQA